MTEENFNLNLSEIDDLKTGNPEASPSAETTNTSDLAEPEIKPEIINTEAVTKVDLNDFQENESSHNEMQVHENSGLTLSSVLLILALFAILSFGIFQIYQTKTFQKQQIALEAEIEKLRTSNIVESKDVNLTFKSKFYAQTKLNQIFWSNVLNHIETTLPDPRKIRINSIAGSDKGNLTLNINSNPESPTPFKDTADLITAFKTQKSFEQILVPSIGANLNQLGQSQLTYNLQLQYLKDITTDHTPLKPGDFQAENDIYQNYFSGQADQAEPTEQATENQPDQNN